MPEHVTGCLLSESAPRSVALLDRVVVGTTIYCAVHDEALRSRCWSRFHLLRS